jgi:hypothetical protein
MDERSEIQLISGPWDEGEVSEFLRRSTIPIRLATRGWEHPLVQSVWFDFDGDTIWCCTQADSLLARRLRNDPACGFEVAADNPPYRGVRGHGVAGFHPEQAGEVLDTLIDRYLDDDNPSLAEWLQSRLDNEVAIAIRNLRVSSWDYSPRMS